MPTSFGFLLSLISNPPSRRAPRNDSPLIVIASAAKQSRRRRGRGAEAEVAENIITTAVGTGEKGFAGDGGPAEAALLNGPFDVAFDATGNLYFSDTFNCRIRR